jgi:hypothetical protein
MVQARFATLAVVAWLAMACGGRSAGSESGAPTGQVAPRPQRARRDANVILQDEIDGVSAQTLYDVIRALRPAWLVERAPSTLLEQRNPETPIVYMDGIRLGDVETLRQLVPSTIVSARHYSAIEAQARFGTGHPAGVIELMSRP